MQSQAIVTGSGTRTTTSLTNEYDDPASDSPSSIVASDGTWTRYVTGPDGTLLATVDSTGTLTWQIQDQHGDIVGTMANSGSTITYDDRGTDPFGVPNDGQDRLYQYEGAHQRAGDTAAGIILMGDRLYEPALGRFLQTDPVPGGSANTYDYVDQDPVDGSDLEGQFSCFGICHAVAHGVTRAAHAGFKHRGVVATVLADVGCVPASVSVVGCAALQAGALAIRQTTAQSAGHRIQDGLLTAAGVGLGGAAAQTIEKLNEDVHFAKYAEIGARPKRLVNSLFGIPDALSQVPYHSGSRRAE